MLLKYINEYRLFFIRWVLNNILVRFYPNPQITHFVNDNTEIVIHQLFNEYCDLKANKGIFYWLNLTAIFNRRLTYRKLSFIIKPTLIRTLSAPNKKKELNPNKLSSLKSILELTGIEPRLPDCQSGAHQIF